jgi:hypothetical protein
MTIWRNRARRAYLRHRTVRQMLVGTLTIILVMAVVAIAPLNVERLATRAADFVVSTDSRGEQQLLEIKR